MNKIILVKVGPHSQESMQEIVKRKNKEVDTTGVAFFGYHGGPQPIKRVIPFTENSINVKVLMNEATYARDPHPDRETFLRMTRFTTDGKTWNLVPTGINTDCMFAFVLGNIKEVCYDIDLSVYTVGIGPKKGIYAKNYLIGRVSKACLEKTPIPSEQFILPIHYEASLLPPYGVTLKRDVP